MAVTPEGLTLEAFLELPEEEPALEYEEGVVSQKVPPQGKHAGLQMWIGELINHFARPKKLALAFSELRTTFGGRSRVPDLVVYRWDRVPLDDRGRIANEFHEPPDVAVEIVSPGQSVNYLVRRCLWYVENGVRIALLVDPSDESVLLFRPGHTPMALHGDDRIDLDDVLPGFELRAHEVFDALMLS